MIGQHPAPTKQGTMAPDEAVRLLANTRRTLLKLVANIDTVIEAASAAERQERKGEEEANATR